MKNERLKGNLMLLVTAMIWGSAFVAQSVGNSVGPCAFNASRSLIACLVLAPTALLFDKAAGRRPSLWGTDDPAKRQALIKGGLSCGLLLACATLAQQVGMTATTVGKAGFITALYIVIVPLMGLFMKKRVSFLGWVAVAVALAGMYLLCMTDGFSLGPGDTMVLLCAFLFSTHIIVVDHFSPLVDGVRLSCIQFAVVAVISGVLMLIFEKPDLSAIADAWLPVLYAGVLSSGAAYTLQILGQKRTGPVVGSLIMSLESVFALLSGWLLLNEALTSREAAGCALMFCSIIMAQIPVKKRGNTARA